MKIQHIAAFAEGAQGGTPIGVALCDLLPDTQTMQTTALEVGHSETVFAAPGANGWWVRYFSPAAEVDFSGHATIALGAALASSHGNGLFPLQLNRARLTVEGYCLDGALFAALQSPPVRSRKAGKELAASVRALFGLTADALDPAIPPTIAHAGSNHFYLALRDREALSALNYEAETCRALALREGLGMINLVHAEAPRRFRVRTPFPPTRIYETPTSGAAALAGYLRDLRWKHDGAIEVIHEGEAGATSHIVVEIPPERGASVRILGKARLLTPEEGKAPPPSPQPPVSMSEPTDPRSPGV